MRALSCCLFVLLAAGAVAADPYDDALKAFVDKAVAAADGGDKATLTTVATRPSNPSGWEVLEVLCARAQWTQAQALAQAADALHREGMTGYVATRRKAPLPPETLERFFTARRLAVQGKFDESLPAMRELAEGSPSVVACQAARIAAGAHKRGRRIPEMIDALAAAARHARAIGWRKEWIQRAFEGSSHALDAQDLDRAEPLAREAVAAARAIGHVGYLAQTIVTLAQVLGRRGKVAETPALWREAIPLYESVGETGNVAVLLGNLGADLTLLGKYTEALEAQEKALAIKEELDDEAGAAATIGNLGVLLFAMGRYEEAWARGEEALRRKRALGDLGEVATTLAGLGDWARSTGDYAGALTRLDEAVAVAREADAKASLGFALGRLGAAHSDLGNVERAAACYREGRVVLEETGALAAASHLLQAHAGLHLAEGEYEEALALAEACLAMRSSLEIPHLIGGAHQLIAGVYNDWGRAEEAEPHIDKAMEIAVAARSELAIAYANQVLGGVHAQRGRDAQARKALASALEVARAHGDVRLETAVLSRRVEIALLAKRFDDGIALALEAAERLRTQFRHLGQEERARAGARWNEALVYGLEAARLAERPKDAFRILEAGRAAALRESLGGGEALRAAVVPEALRREAAEAAARLAAASRAARAASGSRRLAKRRAAKAELETARAELEALAVRLEREAKAAAQVIQPEAASLARVQSMLGSGRALVMYTAQGEQASALLVRKGSVRHIALGPTEGLREACESLHRDGEGDLDPDVLAALRKRLVEPLRLGAKETEVWISPDGPTSYVPFGLLVGTRDILHVPSATTALQLAPEAAKKGKGVLALGDPSYGTVVDESKSGLRSAFRLTPLPATREEAKAVGDVLLLGDDATEAGFMQAVRKRPRWRAVHLACHGLVDPDRPAFCALALTPSTEDDGFLTALEIMQRPIRADLVALSACETGRGKVYGGEGIVGLTRAFMLAGAPRVLVSLWKVDDEATRILMESFYDHWAKGATAPSALRNAQEHVRTLERTTVDREASRKAGRTIQTRTTPYADPRFWAAWVLWGAP